MAWRVGAACVAAALGLSSAGDAARCADEEAKPFPVGRTQILVSGGTYFVEGRVRIGKGVSITVQKDTKLVGRSADGGTIEVEGELQVHGTQAARDTFQDVSIEPQAKFGQILIDTVDFVGTSQGIRSGKDVAVDGRFMIQNCEFKDRSTIDVTMTANEMGLHRLRAANPVRVRAVDPAGSTGNKVKLMVMNCCPAGGSAFFAALNGGLVVERVNDVSVRTNRIGGERASFTDCATVTFDGNLVQCKSLEFVQSAAGRFGGTTVSKCDFLCDKLVAYAPYVEGRAETLSVERCWFDGDSKPSTIRDRFVKDRSRDPRCGVTVEIKKCEEKPLGLAGEPKKK